MHPVCIGISFVCALLNALALNGKKAVGFTLKFVLPMMVLITVINPLFNHRGATVLTFFPWGNPLTLESVLYGVASAVLIGSVALWFSCFHKVMTSDKLIYLFGRVAPALSLMLSMALRFVPRFIAQFKEVSRAQRQCFAANKKQSLLRRFRSGLRVLSVMVSWSLENAIDTSDSMKSRGYGLKGRTSFSLFHFRRQDAVLLGWLLAASIALMTLLLGGWLPYRYFPSLKGSFFDEYSMIVYGIYWLMLLTPLFINIGEGIKWKRLRSNI